VERAIAVLPVTQKEKMLVLPALATVTFLRGARKGIRQYQRNPASVLCSKETLTSSSIGVFGGVPS
jgi:hypothetical protein